MHSMSQASARSNSGINNKAAAVVDMSQPSQEHQAPGERPRATPAPHEATKMEPVPAIVVHPSSAATELSRYEEDIDDNPYSHFLSPVHMYESWDDSDDDSDHGSFEFDAGITDFALFNDEYKRAKEQNLPLSEKWNDFVQDQAECLDRAMARTRVERTDRQAGPSYSGSVSARSDPVPSLTPDTSPRLVDDLDYDSTEETTTAQPYQTKIVTPESIRLPSSPINIPARSRPDTISESAIEDDDFEDPTAPAFLLYHHSQRTDKRRQPAKPQPAPTRPGLSAGSRTLSGKLHVWRRPSWDLFSVDEEREEEAEQDECRGRGRDGTLRKKKGRQELRG